MKESVVPCMHVKHRTHLYKVMKLSYVNAQELCMKSMHQISHELGVVCTES